MAAPGGRPRPLRCFAIRVLSSASWRLSGVDSFRMWFRGRPEVPAETFASLIPPASPAPPIYEVMGDHGSPPGPLAAAGDHALHLRGAKSQEAGCRSKGMAVRGLVSGGDPRSGEDERQRTFRRPPAPGRR